MPIIKLKASDGVILPYDSETIILNSSTFKERMEKELTDNVLSLPKINSHILKMILEWLEHHKNFPIQMTRTNAGPRDGMGHIKIDEQTKISMSEWDRRFLNLEQKTLSELLKAAFELKIEKLIDFVCLALANMMRGMTMDQIRQTFNLINDCTDDEEKIINQRVERCKHMEAPKSTQTDEADLLPMKSLGQGPK